MSNKSYFGDIAAANAVKDIVVDTITDMFD